MKSVLISIQPKWCEFIASGKKTVEVCKTRPKSETPFKCYIYETKSEYKTGTGIFAYGIELKGTVKGRGKVIGEFVCDEIEDILCLTSGCPEGCPTAWYGEVNGSCLTTIDLMRYGKGKILYGWHISDLKIYDKPKELKEFKKEGFMTEDQWLDALYPNTHCHYAAWAKKFEITRPPQSWCYVEQ